jgi:hypothetical protein
MGLTRQHALGRAFVALGGAVLALVLSFSGTAWAGAFSDTFNDYKAHGRVDPCKFSAAVLKQAKGQVPPDIQQYAPDFPAALDAALQARARGACSKSGSAAGAGGGAPGAPAAPGGQSPSPGAGTGGAPGAPGTASTTPAPPPTSSPPPDIHFRNLSHITRRSSGTPAALIVLAAIAAALALPALAYGLARWRGWEPGWMPGVRHTLAEASFRASNGWGEFADWLRFGH